MRSIISMKRLAAWAGESRTNIGEAMRYVGGALFLNLADRRIASGNVLAVYLECGGIKTALGESYFGRVKIKGARHYPLEDDKYPTPAAFARAVEIAKGEMRAAKSRLVLVIPKAWVIFRRENFPLVAKDHLSEVMAYEFDRLVPFQAEGAYYDFHVTKESDRVEVLLAAVKTELLEPYLKALTDKGIDVASVIASTSALGALAAHMGSGGAVVFLDLNSSGYEGGVVASGKLTSVMSGRAGGAAPEQWRDIYKREIDPLFVSLRSEGSTPRLILTGGRRGLPAEAGIYPQTEYFEETGLEISI
ncbi:MAG: hypothetical protein PHY31_05530, partial [Smithellaceae bacterium]|nr:hypothetical protein [Smithellaceae bacterium]